MFESGDQTSLAPRPSPTPSVRIVGAARISAKSDRSSAVPWMITVMSVSRPFAFRVVKLGPRGDGVSGASVVRPARPRRGARARRRPRRSPSVASRLASAAPLEGADRPDARLRDPLVEDVVVDVADEDAVALGIRRRALDRRLAAEQRRHLRVLDDLAAEAEPEILGQHVRRVRDETGKLGWRGRGSGGSPLVAVRVRIGARLPLRGKRVGGGCRPGVQVVLARMVVQVDQAGEKEILRAGADDARTRRPRRPPAGAGLARRRRSARCAQGRGRVGSRCARRPS